MTPAKFAKRLTALSDYNVTTSQVRLWNNHKDGNDFLTEQLAAKIANQWQEEDPDQLGDPYGLIDIQSVHLESLFEESIVHRDPVPWKR